MLPALPIDRTLPADLILRMLKKLNTLSALKALYRLSRLDALRRLHRLRRSQPRRRGPRPTNDRSTGVV
jgi:hypothetical protein